MKTLRVKVRQFFSSEPGRFVIFLLFAGLVRSPLFGGILELDHDVSTYLVMANEWLRGSVPFTFYIDVKPIGIYALFALVIKLFGHNEYGVRIAAIVFIGLTAYFIHRILKLLGHESKVSVGGGLLYIVMISLHKWSWASNTEIFFVFFSTWGLYLLLRANTTRHFIWFGLVMGLGFIFKYHVLFDLAAFGIFYLIVKVRERGFVCTLRDLSISFIAFLVPFALCHLYYYSIDAYPEFLYASFTIPSRYSNSVGILERIGFFGEFLLSFTPFVIFILIALLRKEITRRELLLNMLWFAMAWVAIFLTGKRFFHYYIQAIPALTLLTVSSFAALAGNWTFKKTIRSIVLISVLVFGALWSQLAQLRKYWDPEIHRMNIQMKDVIRDSDRIYIQQANILYFLWDKAPMQRYVHNTLMFDEDHIDAFGIELDAEYTRIMLEAPEHLILPLRGNPGFDKEFMNQYEIEDIYSEEYVHWSRKSTLLP